MSKKLKNVGRGSQIIDKIKSKSQGEEKGFGSAWKTDDSSTSSSSHEQPFVQQHRKKHEELQDIGPGPSGEGPAKEPAVGRGHFLAQLAKQSKYKSSTEPGEHPFAARLKRDEDPFSPESEGVTEGKQPAPIVRLGSTGEKIKMHCNYITLRTSPGKGIFEYEVEFEPPIESSKIRYKLVETHFPKTKGTQCFDGMYRLFLPEAEEEPIVVVGEYYDESGSGSENEKEKEKGKISVTITATYKRKVRLEECSNFYNILFNNCAKVLKLTRLGRHHYDSKANLFIPQHKLEVWPGYVTSVEEFEGGIHLCCDVKHRILRTDTAYDVLGQIIKADPKNFKNKAIKDLLGQCILTRYNNHMYRIDDIAWDETPLSTFSAKGREISYVDYYRTQYNITIEDVQQPLLIHVPKRKMQSSQICLIPELSHMTGLTDAMRKDLKVMKDVSIYTRITPAQREYSLKKFIENIQKNSDAQKLLDTWGLKICHEPVLLDGRVLPPEDIIFRNEKAQRSESADWLKYLRTQGVMRSVDIIHWVMLFNGRDTKLADAFLKQIQEIGPNLGIRISKPDMVSLKDDRVESYVAGLKDNIKPNTQIVLCLCGTPREDRYSAIKKFCCVEMPIPSQVVNCTSISRDNRMKVVAQNVTLQMNVKLGGASWALNVPLKNCMVCGIDTYHEANQRNNSVGAFVASLDSKYTQWYSQACVQEPKQELLTGLVVCFAAALQKYHTVNNKLPERVVIFRDGVSDGHLKTLESVEIQQFLNAFNLVEGFNPKFSYVVVQKRINTKFYLYKGGQLENPKPGSVLDHTVTRRNFYDFFLVSQHVSCGTATPSHYIVLYDNSDLKPDYMQRLTYKFCHMYYNWPGTIRVPAPCQYAHKLAFLVGQNIKKEFSGKLKDKLFYL